MLLLPGKNGLTYLLIIEDFLTQSTLFWEGGKWEFFDPETLFRRNWGELGPLLKWVFSLIFPGFLCVRQGEDILGNFALVSLAEQKNQEKDGQVCVLPMQSSHRLAFLKSRSNRRCAGVAMLAHAFLLCSLTTYLHFIRSEAKMATTCHDSTLGVQTPSLFCVMSWGLFRQF